MSQRGDAREDLARMLKKPEPASELARAALLVAAESDPEADIEGSLRQLDEWAAELARRFQPGWNNLQKLARLRAFLFEELDFRGDERDYFSPGNSLLHEVLKRRRGIPLTLAIVMLEVSWRVGLPMEGVGFPAHFLVRLTGEPRDLLLDPFRGGRSVHEEDCQRMLRESTGGRIEFEAGLIASVGKRDIIQRLLRNLKGAYVRAGDDERALSAVDRLLLLEPGDPDEVRDRGLLLFRLGRWNAALECLTSYLKRARGAPDYTEIRSHAAALRQLLASLN